MDKILTIRVRFRDQYDPMPMVPAGSFQRWLDASIKSFRDEVLYSDRDLGAVVLSFGTSYTEVPSVGKED